MDAPLLDQVAERVLRESLRLKKGENVTIETWNNGLPLARRALVHSRELGAVPVLIFEDEESYVEGLKMSPKDTIGKMGRHESALLSKTDAYIFIPGPVLGGSPKLTRDEVVKSTGYNHSWYRVAKAARLRGARLTFGYVGEEMARVLGKRLPDVVEHQPRASLVDFRKIRVKGKKLAKLMKPRGKVTVRAQGEALRFRLGREQETDDAVVDREDVAAGNIMTNVPPGYFVREIVSDTLSGAVRMHEPLPRLGTVVDIRLEFAGGKLKSWESEKSQEWLDEFVMKTPEKSRTFSAAVVGLNPLMGDGYAQDRLVEGAITLFGMFQGTTRKGSLEVDGRSLVDEGRIVE
jgi:leucyl aminopeptidase (aminopeptidase T)